MKQLTLQTLAVCALLFTTLGCKKTEELQKIINLEFIVIHDDYDHLGAFGEPTKVGVFYYDENGNSNSSIDADPSQTIFENLELGGTGRTTVTITSDLDRVSIQMYAAPKQAKQKNILDKKVLKDGDVVQWNTKDDEYVVNPGSGGGTGGSNESCDEWLEFTGACLSAQAGSNGYAKAGVRSRICRISETSNSVTYKVTFEPINGGIDDIAYYKYIYMEAHDQSNKILRTEFNSKGWETTVTTDKYYPPGEYPVHRYVDCRPQ